jgi:uncharacterized protein YacL
MRKELFVGLSLSVAALIVVLISGALDLELESVALLGAAMGAVVGLVPDRTALVRMSGFVGGFVFAWIGYFVRAALLPDTTAGRAVAVAVTLLLCLGLTLALRGRLPLWAVLLGTGTFAGAYELTYSAAPPEILDTSVSTATTVLLMAAIGFLSVAWFGPEHEHAEERELAERRAHSGDATPHNSTDSRDDNVALDTMMGKN